MNSDQSDRFSELLQGQNGDAEKIRSGVVKVLADNYIGLYYFNLHTGSGTVVHVSDRIQHDTGKNLTSSRNLVEAFGNYVSTLVHPDDRKFFAGLRSVDSLKEILGHRKRYSIVFRRNYDGEYKYTEMTFAKAEDIDEEPVNVAVGYAEIDSEYKNKLLQEKNRQKVNDELRAAKAYTDLFIGMYVSAYYVDLRDWSYRVYRRTDELTRNYGGILNFRKSAHKYAELELPPEDCTMLKSAIDADFIRGKLREENEFSVAFRNIATGNDRYFRMHVIHGEDDDHVAIGFMDIDKEIREHARIQSLENAHANTLAMERTLLALQSDEMLTNVSIFLQMILECLNADYCYMTHYDYGTGTLIIDSGAAVSKDGRVDKTGCSVSLDTFEAERDDMILDGVRELNAQEVSRLWDAYGMPENDPRRRIVSVTGMPLRVRGNIWGSINVAFSVKHSLDDEEKSFMKRAMLVLGSAIERKGVYASLADAKDKAQREAEFVIKAIDIMPMPCFVKDADDEFRYVRCNEAFAKHIGYSKERIFGHSDKELFDSNFAVKSYEYDKLVSESENPVSYEMFGGSDYDHDRSIIRWKTRIIGADGHRLVLGLIRDVTEERMRTASETFKADVSSFIVNNNDNRKTIDFIAKRLMEFFRCEHVMLHCTDGNRRDWFVNSERTYCNICDDCPLRGAKPEVFGRSNVLKIDDTSACSLKLPKGCPAKSIQARQIFKDGRVWGKLAVIYTGRIHKFLNTGEHVLQMATDLMTLSLQREDALDEISRKNDELLNALDEAKRAERIKSIFLATMSHEIRTPLNAVIGFSEFLRADNYTEEEKQSYLDGIAKSSHALLALINDVLDLSKLEVNAVDMKGGKCDLLKLMNEMRTVFQFRMHEKNLAFKCDIADDFPLLDLREERIRQILLNLVGNAVKFTESGYISCIVRWYSESRTVVISVEDTGIGISLEKQLTIFDPFTQDSGVRGEKVYEGTGLGLPIAKRLAEAAGGTLELSSMVGKGSTFTLRIPNVNIIGKEDKKSDNFIEDDVKELKIPADFKIVLVDDVPLNLRILKLYLKKMGIPEEQIEAYPDGASALHFLLDRMSDGAISKKCIVLTDVWMPEMNGEELARAIRAVKALEAMPIVAVTADADTQSSFHIDIFDAILTKPVTSADLRRQLLAMLRRMQSEKQ